jgi:hypothetical protein
MIKCNRLFFWTYTYENLHSFWENTNSRVWSPLSEASYIRRDPKTSRRYSVSQTIVFRYKEIGGYIVYETSRKLYCFLLKNGTQLFFSMFRTQYFPDFFVAEHYGLRNTICTSWWSKDLASRNAGSIFVITVVIPMCVTYLFTLSDYKGTGEMLRALRGQTSGRKWGWPASRF